MGLIDSPSAFGDRVFFASSVYVNPFSVRGNIPGAFSAVRVAHAVFPETIDGIFHSGVEDPAFSPEGEIAIGPTSGAGAAAVPAGVAASAHNSFGWPLSLRAGARYRAFLVASLFPQGRGSSIFRAGFSVLVAAEGSSAASAQVPFLRQISAVPKPKKPATSRTTKAR